MRSRGASIFIVCFAVLAAMIFPPAPSAAFGLRLGPFHLGLPFFGRLHVPRRRIALRPDARKGDAVYDKASLGGAEGAQHAEPALLYSAVALPDLYDEVFWPQRAAAWPFGYDAIFRSAFAKSPLDDDAHACRQPDRAEAVVGRIRAEVKPRPAQLPLLQNLGRALGMASAYLLKACPKAIPAQPVARLSLMQSQIQVLSMAIDLVRPPLQQFEQSLDAGQKARFAAMPSSSTASAECGAAATATDWSVDQIDQSVQPGKDQRQALADLKETFASVAADLHAHCPNPPPTTPLARLQAIEARLDASWRAALSMQVALAKFESQLNAEQRDRFEAMNLAEAR
jgi:hypothetical protein